MIISGELNLVHFDTILRFKNPGKPLKTVLADQPELRPEYFKFVHVEGLLALRAWTDGCFRFLLLAGFVAHLPGFFGEEPEVDASG